MKALTARSILLSVAVAFPAASVLAADYSSLIEQRKRAYGEIGAAFKGINDQLRRPTPLLMMIRRYAVQINGHATEQATDNWFPAGSGPEAGVKTAAKPEIWSQAPKFRGLQVNFKRSADALSGAVNSGNVTAIQAQARVLGEVCAACHRDFRERT